VLFLDYDRAHIGLADEPAAEEATTADDVQSVAESPAQPKRSRKQAA
jgi:hypothetical protein